MLVGLVTGVGAFLILFIGSVPAGFTVLPYRLTPLADLAVR
jgi:hypothetical protein